jgi:hypothetical protein
VVVRGDARIAGRRPIQKLAINWQGVDRLHAAPGPVRR